MQSATLRLSLLLSALGAALAAPADVTTSSLASWQASTSTYTALRFTGLASGTAVGSTYASSGVTFRGVDALSSASLFPSDGAGITAPNVAFSISLSGTAVSFAYEGVQTNSEYVEFYRGSSLVGFVDQYRDHDTGFTSSVPFDRIEFTGVDSGPLFPSNVDNMYFGRITPVPEPAPLAALGLGGLTFLRRRRRA